MISNNKAPAKTSQTVIKPVVSNVKAVPQPVKKTEVKASPIQKNVPQVQATQIQKPAPNTQNQVQTQPIKKEAKKPQKEESKNQKTPIKKESKAPPQNLSKAPAQKEQQKIEQFVKAPVFQFKRTINLKAIQEALGSDKDDDNKCSLILDETGAASSFFKYAGVLMDISSYQVQEGLGQLKREDCIENARKTFVSALGSGKILVLFVDLMIINLVDFFKGAKFFSDPESIFTYSKLMKEEFYKSQILKPEEDVDYLGNKGFYLAKKDFKICVLCNVTQGSSYNPLEIIQKLGLDQLKNCFNTTLVEA